MALSSAYYKQDFKLVSAVKRLVPPPKPIYLIEVDDGSHLVLKREPGGGAVSASNIKFANNAMKLVSDGLMAKPLKDAETRVLRHFVDDSRDIANICGTDEDPEIVDFRKAMEGAGQWVKMQKIDGIYTLETAMREMSGDPTKGTPGNKTGVRKFAASLNAPNGFETLGQVVAVDLFTGNDDRFSPSGSNTMNPRTGVAFKTLVNVGNVMVVMRDGVATGKVAGMDAYDPFNQVAKFHKTDLPTSGDPSDVYWGNMLSSKGKNRLTQYYKDICEDLEAVWGDRNRKLFLLSKKRLDSRGPTRMLAGTDIVKQKLRLKLQGMLHKPGAATASIQARLNVLNS